MEHSPQLWLVDDEGNLLMYQKADERGGARRGVEDMPGLGLAVGLALQFLGDLVVGVQVNRQHGGSVYELGKSRKYCPLQPRLISSSGEWWRS